MTDQAALLLPHRAIAECAAAIAAAAARAITYAVLQTMLVSLRGAARAYARDPISAEALLRRATLANQLAAVRGQPATVLAGVAAATATTFARLRRRA
ncbi:MAG: hypothetical protein AVDCRST_MAG67-2219 [uncultured Solirubrobacteraceae bacterium]|uniref:Uncharacterized protein n=1 Tax=uncultured Solirubrobacteraceae bacterium TaxID=1162706 RepID=A0A6J4SSM7_9ACTN|nr:MAG: hypothetical protein AVDCRST_MAG67-2219 [uncultured Solirubrobacteraceae bacterium]